MVSAPPVKPKPQRVADPRLRRVLKDDAHKLTAVGGLAALSLDALSSVAYGPEAIVLALIAGGVGAITFTLPVAIAITVLLIVLVFSYRQVIAVHPEGGGSYAVAKKDLGRGASLVAAASLVVDYVLTVAVSLAAGAASLASAFPSLAPHLLSITLIGLAILTVINLIGISESAKVLMLPTLLFIVCIIAVIVFGLMHSTPVAVIGKDLGPVEPVSALGIILVLKAFAAGCSSLTGVEAIANGVPAFKTPAIKRAQNTEVALGILLGVMLIGLSVLIKAHHVVPRGDVTILAQLSAAAFGTGWPFYVTNVTVALILGFAANTSFGGLPVLMSLLAKDDRMPHLFGLRAEKPVYRYGVVALALFSAIILIVSDADTHRLLPLFAIGVFIGFTISQTGLVKHWFGCRTPGWQWKAALNGFGATLSAIAMVVFFVSKFTEGAWVLLLIIPSLILLFGRTENYYQGVKRELALDELPALTPNPPDQTPLVIVPIDDINKRTVQLLEAALHLGGEVVPVIISRTDQKAEAITKRWAEWNPGLELIVLPTKHRSLVTPLVEYVKKRQCDGRQVTVLITEIKTKRRWHQILHNQTGIVLTANLIDRTDAIVANYPYRMN
ncbi:APC family permease [Mycobacteroides immunogenum]|uniref:Amino acid permease n=1 Tax=Mycobacteroides immunogenum TaxID=83262 RepID=A0A0N1CKE0_9MYCO|nr:APC family permease [Mycobacteroides immunogenum]AMT70328.1 amino acid permease [Mycobacteroides immunogenum]ANO03393.1 amino acid permease [Mycobacteroides immunogenum]KIU42139.1 amino acid permease [Mycobacteroides immunogenum]KPG13415.1 amino acid permease [Mycobacteroides immunogenum]KPG14666.1 amino acid permease [Mycobacteroides immunogenum]